LDSQTHHNGRAGDRQQQLKRRACRLHEPASRERRPQRKRQRNPRERALPRRGQRQWRRQRPLALRVHTSTADAVGETQSTAGWRPGYVSEQTTTIEAARQRELRHTGRQKPLIAQKHALHLLPRALRAAREAASPKSGAAASPPTPDRTCKDNDKVTRRHRQQSDGRSGIPGRELTRRRHQHPKRPRTYQSL
jgi:hypothetical protein